MTEDFISSAEDRMRYPDRIWIGPLGTTNGYRVTCASNDLGASEYVRADLAWSNAIRVVEETSILKSTAGRPVNMQESPYVNVMQLLRRIKERLQEARAWAMQVLCPNCDQPLTPAEFHRADGSLHSTGYACSKCRKSFNKEEAAG